jgi:hypothetical protein
LNIRKKIEYPQKKRGAAGITTAAPHVAGQWGRGDNRLSKRRTSAGVVPVPRIFF